MNELEIRLRCLELAIQQANRETPAAYLDRVAELQTWFYTHITSADTPPAAPEKSERKGRGTKTAADKATDILS